MMNTWYLVRSEAADAPYNMAFDEALLESMPRLQKPVLRFYGWTEPAASFGYFQKYKEVEKLTPLRPLVRRPTGGGIVPHDADWTYSLTFPTNHVWYALKAVDSYRSVHEWLQAAFAKLRVATEVAPCCLKSGSGQCFLGHEQYDLLWQGRKIAGAAQRRTRQGLLIQGSVQPPPIRQDRTEWDSAMCRSGPAAAVEWAALPPDPELPQAVQALVAEKYSRESYNRKR
jgi:lipoyl(octanoyl) transferase